MDKDRFYDLVSETVSELNSIMKVSLKEQVKDLAKSALGRSVRTKDPMFWPAGMLMLGLVQARELILGGLPEADDNDEAVCGKSLSGKHDTSGSGNNIGSSGFFGENDKALKLISEIDSAVKKHVRLWKEGYGERIDYIDDALAGAALIKLYEQKTLDDELKDLCRQAADKIYAYLIKAPRERSGAIAYNAERSGSNVFADGIGQTSVFLSLYGSVFGVPKALELAGEELAAFKRYGCDERSRLPYHGYALSDRKRDTHIQNDMSVNKQTGDDGQKTDPGFEVVKKGVLSWGRAAGWLIMGLSEYVRCSTERKHQSMEGVPSEKLPGSLDNELKLWYNNLSETLVSYQRRNGGFAWQIQAVEGPLDTSATGMITYGLLNGIRKNFEDNPSEFLNNVGCARPDSSFDYLQPSIDIMEKSIIAGKVGSALSSCDDFGVHYQTYGHYPWGQGAVLAALSSYYCSKESAAGD
ncbi:MAG: glycoside hydrolase family 88 protein [Butyrivibrio sp.]|nr:glycoside hydrolase family 88 protein [Butyrivibrio sp.]